LRLGAPFDELQSPSDWTHLWENVCTLVVAQEAKVSKLIKDFFTALAVSKATVTGSTTKKKLEFDSAEWHSRQILIKEVEAAAARITKLAEPVGRTFRALGNWLSRRTDSRQEAPCDTWANNIREALAQLPVEAGCLTVDAINKLKGIKQSAEHVLKALSTISASTVVPELGVFRQIHLDLDPLQKSICALRMDLLQAARDLRVSPLPVGVALHALKSADELPQQLRTNLSQLVYISEAQHAGILLQLYKQFLTISTNQQQPAPDCMHNIKELLSLARQRISAGRRQEIIYYTKMAELQRERSLLSQEVEQLQEIKRTLLRRIALVTANYHWTRRAHQETKVLRYKLESEVSILREVRFGREGVLSHMITLNVPSVCQRL
jgi:hypothetical protein